MKTSKMMLCASALALALSGCSSGSKNSTGSTQVLNLAKENDVITMDSTLATDGMSFEVINMIIEGLETTNEEGDIVPALAKSYEVSDDGLTYTFHLRDAKWSNGDPVTASDFEYAWKDAASDPTSDYAYIFGTDGACIKGASEAMGNPENKDALAVKAEDEKTFVVELERKTPYFVSLTTFPPFYPVNEKFAEEQGEQYGLSPENLLFCGPFKLEEWTKGNSLKLSKNENYWDAENVALEEINISIVPEPSSAALAFENGTTDYARLNSSLVDKYKDNEAYQSVLGSFLWYLQYNLENSDLQNENLRKALAYAVDRDNLTQNVLKDGSIAAEGFVTKQLANGPDGKDYRETTDGYFLERGQDSEKLAQEYFEKAKQELGKDEINLRFLFEPSDPSKSAAEFMQSEFAKLDGLNIAMISQEKNVRLKTQQNGDFDLVLTRWGPDYADPTTYLNVILPDTSFNYGHYRSEEYKKALDEAANAKTDEERWELLKKAEKIAMDDVAIAPIFQTGASDLINPKVKHLVDNPVGVPFVYKYVTIEE
ncbi:hypothetical protein C815_02270 [Firmicutes bacterium M10-2]|nr:hypothetical protein C815_02270 [Firmicutes bacterium M10-2]